MIKIRILRLLAPTLLAAALAFATVRTDYDHHANFGRYRTYSWTAIQAGDSLWQERIQKAVDSELAARGWRRVPSGGAAAVCAASQTSERDTVQTFYSNFPAWGFDGFGASFGTATTVVIPESIGNLVVDIFDSSNQRLIWRGTASKVLSSRPNRNIVKLNRAVAQMFRHFPPAAND